MSQGDRADSVLFDLLRSAKGLTLKEVLLS